MSQIERPTPLLKFHDCGDFDCGSQPLNTFLTRFALGNQANNSARTLVVVAEMRVVGYYSLAASAVAFEEAPSRLSSGLARHPVPVILMARFAVDLGFQGRGIGTGMFRDAIGRSLNVSREIGARAFTVHAKDADAAAYYGRFDMEAFPEDPLHMFLLMNDVERALRVD